MRKPTPTGQIPPRLTARQRIRIEDVINGLSTAEKGRPGGVATLSPDGTVTGAVNSVAAVSPLTASGSSSVTVSTSIATARLVGRTTAGSGVMESLSVVSPLALGTGTLTTSMATNKLLGRGTAGTGVVEQITLGTNLSLTGTTLNAAGGSGDVVGPSSSVASEVALFDGTTGKLLKSATATGVATVTSGVLGTDAGLTSLAGQDSTLGLPYVTAADTWFNAALGDLSVAASSWVVTQARGLRESGGTTLTMGAVSDGQVLTRSGTTIIGSTFAAGTTIQNVTGATATVTTDIDVVYVSGVTACTLTLPAASAMTTGHATRIIYAGTATCTIDVVTDTGGPDYIEGAVRVALVGPAIDRRVTKVAANMIVVADGLGDLLWTHDLCDLTAATGASPWSITSLNGNTVTWTDTSSATNSASASSGLLLTNGTNAQAYFGSGLGAAISSPLTGWLDKWSRPVTAEDEFWFVVQSEKTVVVGGSTPSVSITMSGSTIGSTPRNGATNAGGSNGQINMRVSATTSVAYTSLAALTASNWLGARWDGVRSTFCGFMLSSSPSGNPGAASGWWPSSYDASEGYRGLNEGYAQQLFAKSSLTHLRVAQTVAGLGSKFTAYRVAVIRVRRGVR